MKILSKSLFLFAALASVFLIAQNAEAQNYGRQVRQSTPSWGQPQQGNWGQPQQGNWGQPQQGNWNQPQQNFGWNQPQQGNWNQPQQGNWGQPQQNFGWNQPQQGNWNQPQQRPILQGLVNNIPGIIQAIGDTSNQKRKLDLWEQQLKNSAGTPGSSTVPRLPTFPTTPSRKNGR